MRGLQHASGFLQAKVAARLQTRFTPILSFKRDDSVKKSFEITRLIDEAIAADRKLDPAAAVDPPAPGEDDEPADDET
jgi:ribosome-binding factor A